jgi:hypothetical protein
MAPPPRASASETFKKGNRKERYSDMEDARWLRRGTPRNPHTHGIRVGIYVSFVHGHVHAIRDNAKQLASRAFHRKYIPMDAPRRRRRFEKSERIVPVHAQRTSRRGVHIVQLCAPSRAAYHVHECAAGAVLCSVGVCAPTLECLRESDRARCGRSARKCRREGDVWRGICTGAGGGNVPCEWVTVGAAPGVVSDECGDDGWAEEAYCGAGFGNEEEGHEGL